MVFSCVFQIHWNIRGCISRNQPQDGGVPGNQGAIDAPSIYQHGVFFTTFYSHGLKLSMSIRMLLLDS